MLVPLRRLTRPLSFLVLAVLLAPVAADCCQAASATAKPACCVKLDGPDALRNANCCGIEEPPAQHQPPATNPARLHQTTADAQPLRPAAALVPDQTVSFQAPEAISPPGDPLYLRLSSLRR